MRPVDAFQWLCIAAISAGCFLVWFPLGLIVAGILGIVGSSLQTAGRPRKG